jgi:hypothetical protein
MPDSMRIVDPEFPQSNGLVGGSSSSPRPSISTVVPSRRIFAPSACTHERVLAQSAPVEKFSNRDFPSEIAASMPYRCEIDLSPGIRSDPNTFFAGLTSCESFPIVPRASCPGAKKYSS